MKPASGDAVTSCWNAWYRAARPRTLTATYVPLGAAAAIAVEQHVFDVPRFVLSLVAALCLQIAANLVNEYYDFRRGAEDQKQSGQGLILKQGLLSPRQVLGGAIACLSVGIAIGLYLVVATGPLLLLIGIAGVLVAVLYTAGPFPLAYNGLGEITVFIFMGPVMVLGAYYVMAVQVDATPLLVGVPIGLMVAAILHANNIRDIDADRAANKRTLAVIFGLEFARKEYAFLIWGAYITTILLIALGVIPLACAVVILSFSEARNLIAIERTSRDNALLHQAQGRTARLHGRFGLLMVGGWFLSLALQAVLATST